MKSIALLVCLSVVLVSTGCGHEAEEEEAKSIYLATSPLLMDTSVTRDYVCQIHSIQHIELRSLEKGYLQDVLVDEGQFVKEGQLMFRIKPTLYQAEVDRSVAEADYAEIEYRNTKVLADSNVVSPNELAMAKAKMEKARAELSVAQTHLGFTEIRAPFDGIMDRLHARKGSLMDEGDLLTNLSDNSTMWVYFNVPESEYLAYKKVADTERGVKVRLKMANETYFESDGVITAIEADFNNTTGNIAFRATFPNPNRVLRHGQTGNIVMSTRLDHVMLIPQKATFEVLDRRYVFVIDKEGKAHTQRITIGNELPYLFAIDKGLKPDDRFLLEGLRKVKDGDTVELNFTPPDSVIKKLGLYAE